MHTVKRPFTIYYGQLFPLFCFLTLDFSPTNKFPQHITSDLSQSLPMTLHSQVELIMKYNKDGGKTANGNVDPQPHKKRRMVLDGETGTGPHDDTMPLQSKAPDEVSDDGGSEFSADPHEAEDIIEDG